MSDYDIRLAALDANTTNLKAWIDQKAVTPSVVTQFMVEYNRVIGLKHDQIDMHEKWSAKKIDRLNSIETNIEALAPLIANAADKVYVEPAVTYQATPISSPVSSLTDQIYVTRQLPSGQLVLEPQSLFFKYKYIITAGAILVIVYLFKRKKKNAEQRRQAETTPSNS